MPEYLWSGTSPNGEENSAEIVEAENIEAAKAILISRGWTNLQLHQGEISAFIGNSMAAHRGYEIKLTPKEELQFHQGTNPGVLECWWESLVEDKATLAILTLILVSAAYRHVVWLTVISGALLAADILLYPIIRYRVSASSRLFRKLQHARTWWRWDEVLQCIEQLNELGRREKHGMGPAQLARYWGLALAGTGQIDQAIALVNKEATAANMPEWMRLSQISTLYNVAQQPDKALEYRRQAVAASNDDPSPAIDLAIDLVDQFNRVDEAKALLAVIETKTLPELAITFLHRLRGLIAYRENDFRSADTLLRHALTAVEAKAQVRYHVFESSLLILNGQLAVVNAAMGKRAEAEKFFNVSRDYLAATKRQDLIDAYNQHLNRKPVPQAA